MSDDATIGTFEGKGINLGELLPNSPQIPPRGEAATTALLAAIRDLIAQFLAGTQSQRVDAESGRPIWGPCTRCGYVWMGRNGTPLPNQCARCHSPAWQKFRKQHGTRANGQVKRGPGRPRKEENPVAQYFPPLSTVTIRTPPVVN